MNEPLKIARSHRYQEISLGRKKAREYVISQEIYKNFLAAFDDRSPIHVDEKYALASGFKGRVMHGTLLNGFLSHFVGMYFPGSLSVLLAVDLRFIQPCYIEDVICLEAIVSQKLDAQNVIVLNVVFQNLSQKYVAARARVQVMLKDRP